MSWEDERGLQFEKKGHFLEFIAFCIGRLEKLAKTLDRVAQSPISNNPGLTVKQNI